MNKSMQVEVNKVIKKALDEFSLEVYDSTLIIQPPNDDFSSLYRIVWQAKKMENDESIQAKFVIHALDEKPMMNIKAAIYSAVLDAFSPASDFILLAKRLYFASMGRTSLFEAILEDEALTLLRKSSFVDDNNKLVFVESVAKMTMYLYVDKAIEETKNILMTEDT